MATRNRPPVHKEVKIKYRFQDDYHPIYVNGAWGGLNPHGEITVHFFMERLGLPKEQVHELSDGGTILSTRTVSPHDHGSQIVRMVVSGVIMNTETARAIHTWLGEKITAAEGRQQTKAPASERKSADGQDTVQSGQ